MWLYLLVTLTLALPAGSGDAGWVDFYGGQPAHGDMSLALRLADASGTRSASYRFDPDARGIKGLRMRGGGERWPVGIAADFAYQTTDSAFGDFQMMPTTLGLTLPSRLSFGGSGRLRPIGMVGVTYTTVSGDSILLGSSGYGIGDSVALPYGGSRAGLTASAGVEWRLAKHVALFTEYRYQDLRFSVSNGCGMFCTGTQSASGELTTSGFLLGLSFSPAGLVLYP